jgi:hypothetical protein
MDCLACGITGSPATREHVFSSWLLKEFGPNASMALYRHSGDGSERKVRAEIKLDSFRLKRICEDCNNGWMSDLETSAKPLILALIKDGRQLHSLFETERRALARWAAKTAIVESHAVGAECPVSADFLKKIRTSFDGTPGRLAVAARHTEALGFGHLQVGVIRDLIGGGKAAGNIIIIALPKLAFACAFPMLQELPFECRSVEGLYTPLWPPARGWHQMKQTPMPAGVDELEALLSMAERIELFQSVV